MAMKKHLGLQPTCFLFGCFWRVFRGSKTLGKILGFFQKSSMEMQARMGKLCGDVESKILGM